MRMLLLWMIALAGCVESSAQVCESGIICPRGFSCDEVNDRCIRPEQVAACEGLGIADGADCMFGELPGTCVLGACEAWFCGDGVRQGFESCDASDLGFDDERDVGVDCITLGFYGSPGLACRDNCTFDTRGCEASGFCGDELVNGPETCDGDESQTCVAIGFDAGAVTCDGLCSFTIVNCSRFGWNTESLTDVVALAVSGTAHDDQWAVGVGGKAARFDGVFWTPFPTGTTQTLVAVHSISKREVWAIGHAATILRYTEDVDGGNAAWAPVTGVPVGDYIDLWAASSTELYVATANAGILKFDGASWSTLPAVTGTPIAIRGTSGTDLWVATTEGPLQHFDGQTWETESPPNTAVKFIDANSVGDVWVIGHAATDPGTGVIAHLAIDVDTQQPVWTTFVRPGETFNNIASSAPNDAWVAGVDGLMRHFDGVAFSNSINVALPGGVTGISGFLSFGPQELVAVSTQRIAYRYRGQAFGQFRNLGGDPFTGPDNLAFFAFAANDVWLTNANRQVFHFDGLTWELERTLAAPSDAVFGFSPTDVWFGQNDGDVVHFTGTFAAPETAATTKITALVGAGPDLWAFSSGFAARRDGANVWTSFPLATGKQVLSASASGQNDLWAVLDDSVPRLFHFDGVWSEVTTNSPTRLLAVIALSPTDVHVTAEDGHMLHWNGTTFERTQVASIGQVTEITATAPDDVIAASPFDAFHYDGRQWSPLRLPEDIKSPLPGAPTVRALQATPGRVDLMLERFKITTLIRTKALACRTSELPDSCNDGVDNDCDGALDSTDDECQ
jgi:hypothetical protein